jgi:hypothetical protein
MILLLASAGGLLCLIWPFFPRLLQIAPFGAILALGGWFLVIARLRTSGPDEFLAAVEAHEQNTDEHGLSPTSTDHRSRP